MKQYFDTVIEACEYIDTHKLDGYMVVLAPAFDCWQIVNSANEVEYTIDAMIDNETGLVSDPHYAALSTHTPLTPDANCPECQRLGWVAVPVTVQFIEVAA
jgi:hypothetical protein